MTATSQGKMTSARALKGSHTFSQDHFLASFIGRANMPFTAPPMTARKAPNITFILYPLVVFCCSQVYDRVIQFVEIEFCGTPVSESRPGAPKIELLPSCAKCRSFDSL